MSKAARTICPYCNLGCELGFTFRAGQARHVEYLKDSRNEARLCPKGNAAVGMVNHRKRLYHPVIKGLSATLNEGVDYLSRRLSSYKQDEVLLVYDALLTNEEINDLAGWAGQKGFKNLAYMTAGPEAAFLYGRYPALRPEQISTGEYAIIVGDAFAQDSVISGYIGKAKGDNRNFRYVVIDSFATNTSRFAHRFVQVKHGYEGLFLYGLYKHLAGEKVDLGALAEALEIDSSMFESVASMIRNKEGILVNAPVHARSFDPFLTHAAALKLSSVLDGLTYVPLGGRVPGLLTRPFFSYLPMLMGGRIKAVVSLGASCPWSYPQLRPLLRKIEFVAAGSLFMPDGRFELELVLPVASELEKEGTIRTIFGEEKINPLAPRISGSLPAKEYIKSLGGASAPKEELPANHDEINDSALSERVEKLMYVKPGRKKGMKHMLLGSEPAIGFMSIFENQDWVMLNPDDAAFMGVKEGDALGVETEQKESVLQARISGDVPKEVAVVSMNNPSSVILFELEADPATGEGFLKPSWSRIWKK